MKINAINWKNSLSSMDAELWMRSRFMSNWFFKSSNHFSTAFIPVYPKCFYRILDVVGKESIKACIAVTVFLMASLLKDTFLPRTGVSLIVKKGFVGIFMAADNLATFQFCLVIKQFFGKTVNCYCRRMCIIVQMYITTLLHKRK